MTAPLRAAANLALFGASLALTCAAITRLLPLPEVPQVKEKLEWLRAHRSDYNALFLGTSRVRRHVIPPLFDRLAAEQGLEIRSFNLGVDSLNSPEDSYVLDQVLAAQPPHLRYVFIELSYFRQNFAGQAADTVRSAYWHDGERTRAVCRQLLDDYRRIKPLKKRKKDRWRSWSAEVGECASLAATHVRLFLQRATNLGRGSAILQLLSGTRLRNDPLLPLGPARDGFIPSDNVLAGPGLAEYERQLSALRARPDRNQPLTRVAQTALESMLAKVRAHGAEPVLFLAPTPAGVIFQPGRPVAPVIDFSDPAQWPELFDAKRRADITHLNSTGAEIFTRALAGRFLAIAKPPAE